MVESKEDPRLARQNRTDTEHAAAQVQLQVLQEMSPEQRSLQAARFSQNILDTAMAGIRSRHPEYGDAQVRRELARILLPPKLFEEAYGRALESSDAI